MGTFGEGSSCVCVRVSPLIIIRSALISPYLLDYSHYGSLDIQCMV